VLAGSNAPALAQIGVSLPRGLAFNISELARGVIITSPGAKPLLRLSNGRLHDQAEGRHQGRLGHNRPCCDHRWPRSRYGVQRHHVNKLTVVVDVTDAKSNRTSFISHLSTRRY
jgi:hypothetical protein